MGREIAFSYFLRSQGGRAAIREKRWRIFYFGAEEFTIGCEADRMRLRARVSLGNCRGAAVDSGVEFRTPDAGCTLRLLNRTWLP